MDGPGRSRAWANDSSPIADVHDLLVAIGTRQLARISEAKALVRAAASPSHRAQPLDRPHSRRARAADNLHETVDRGRRGVGGPTLSIRRVSRLISPHDCVPRVPRGRRRTKAGASAYRLTVSFWVFCAAAAYVPLPAWLASITQLPAAL
jgi:hypothetical protein